MDRLYAEIGSRMRGLRRALGITQAQLAESAGIDASFYGQIERGMNVPSLRTFLAVARALGVEPSDLLPGAERTGRAYGRAVERLLSGLDSRKRRLVLGMVSDMVGRLKE